MQTQPIPQTASPDLSGVAVAAKIAALRPDQVSELCRELGISIDRPAIALCADCGEEAITCPFMGGDRVCAGCRIERENFLDEMTLDSGRCEELEARAAEEAGLSLTNRSNEH